ncbi:TPA: DUF3549 family protein [Aeromonas veronii]|uniref:DUF3549 family protein n=1 Tax=Aeromonas veronii TaxID=654 RepID=UPI0033095BC4|nr:DUF3549 family protein [Aeromonas veronii]HDO1332457.1 DUF3549 family protein [Aeromonas veronii]HDO1343122.1 DUF3549 family protein [Aeromonas veronii]HDO1347470.1 DUF3549 family protein [Aeromonas veronii]HDO1353147.1 DUF3549 family protein [Aeromonas veronii]
MSATSTAINTLTEFLTQAGTQFQLFDMGRQVRPLASDTFVRIEQQQEPYPWPLQQHAWLGVHFFQPSESRHYLWFLKFALDERGLLMSNGPKLFMDQVVETLGYKLTGDLDEEKAQRLADNPYTFRPAEAKMASLHAKLASQLEQAPSAYYDALCHYLVAPNDTGWQTLGLQGFADLAERLHDERNLALICKALPKLPQEPLYALCQSLENAPLPPAVQGALLEQIGKEQECAAPNPETLAYLCRAMASCPGSSLRTNKLLTLLQTQPSPALLLAIAGRLWPDLKDANLLSHYLEQLALQPTQFFNQVFAELVTLPALRNDMLARLRDPERSDALGKAIGRLFASA